MANLTENKINQVIVAADITAINTSIATITSKIPAGSLTDEERAGLQSLDVDNKIFVEDAINEITISGTGIIPAYINPTFIQNDLALFEQLDQIESSLVNLLQKVSDVKRIAASEAMGMSNAVYKLYEAANTAGIPGAKQAYDKLKVRYQRSGAGRTPDAPIV